MRPDMAGPLGRHTRTCFAHTITTAGSNNSFVSTLSALEERDRVQIKKG